MLTSGTNPDRKERPEGIESKIVNETTRYLHAVVDPPGIEIGQLVSLLVKDAVQAGASDIHIEPWESTLVVRIRLSGVLTELVHLPLDLMERISGRLKVMANLISYQTDLPQEGGWWRAVRALPIW